MQPTPAKKSRSQPKRSSRTETPPQDAPPEVDPGLVAPVGDLVLAVHRSPQPAHDRQTTSPEQQQQQQEEPREAFLYRVDSKRLREVSPYFARLLDPAKFGEGAKVAERHAELRTKYPNPAAVPLEELPQVHIADVGRISSGVKSIQHLMGDFLRALHDQDLSVRLPPLSNVANLAIVADRFDALPTVRQYFRSRKLIAALDAKNGQNKTPKTESEERVRQKLLVGLLLDNPSWVWSSSLRLIHKGWVGREASENSALWWDIPQGIEEELLFRRDMILLTVQSLQSYFLDLYTSRDRQCKLGYDSSAECDLYQLGQMVKFFKKINTLDLQGTLITGVSDGDDEADEERYYDGDIFDLLDEYKKIPEYQIDKNHHHCGLRTRILPLLDLVSFSLTQEVGLCLHCWQDCRNEYAWSRSKRPLMWRHGSAGAGMVQQYKARQVQDHLFRHLDARDLFLAKERIWTGEEVSGNKIGWSHPHLPYRP